jgi:hypothetical protein
MKYGMQRSRVILALERVPGVRRLLRPIYDRWLTFKFELFWKVRNPASRRWFQRQGVALDPVQRSIGDDLKRKGIAITTFDALFGDSGRWESLERSVKAFASGESVRSGIDEYRQALELQRREGPNGPTASQRAKILKKYWVTFYPDDQRPTVSSKNEWLRMALDPRILDLVNSYFGLWSKLTYFDLWHTIPVDGGGGERFGSQRWHRDPDDRTKLRLYLYFVDVDEGAGPLQYVAGSQLTGPLWSLCPWPGPMGAGRVPDSEVERGAPPSGWITCSAPRGSLVICDTIGLHRGGIASTGVRVLATWAFVTPASLHRRRFDVDWSSGAEDLSPAARFAIT